MIMFARLLNCSIGCVARWLGQMPVKCTYDNGVFLYDKMCQGKMDFSLVRDDASFTIM